MSCFLKETITNTNSQSWDGKEFKTNQFGIVEYFFDNIKIQKHEDMDLFELLNRIFCEQLLPFSLASA